MLLRVFEYLARGELVAWWRSLGRSAEPYISDRPVKNDSETSMPARRNPQMNGAVTATRPGFGGTFSV